MSPGTQTIQSWYLPTVVLVTAHTLPHNANLHLWGKEETAACRNLCFYSDERMLTCYSLFYQCPLLMSF